MKEFTPGPWKVSDDNPTVVKAGDYVVADNRYSGVTTHEDVANAMLISQAPEMYDTLKNIRTELLSIHGVFGGGTAVNKIFESINAIVDKIEPERP